MRHTTIYRMSVGDDYVQLLAVDGESYPVTPDVRLFIDGREYMALRCQIEITTGEPAPGSVATGSIVTTITIVPNDRT